MSRLPRVAIRAQASRSALVLSSRTWVDMRYSVDAKGRTGHRAVTRREGDPTGETEAEEAGRASSPDWTKSRVIESALAALPHDWFKASPIIYWADWLGSTVAGWVALGLAVRADGWARAALLLTAAAALYRAVLFIHEITHRARRDVPGFTLLWNTLVGVPLLVPSFLYEGVHLDHHRQRSYGTVADPEYVPYGRRPPQLMVGTVLASVLVPVAFAVRFGVIAPLSWVIPRLRPYVLAHCSALVINHRYRRLAPLGVAGHVQEIAAATVCLAVVWGWWRGVVPPAVPLCWLLVGSTISAVNVLRTMGSHRYDHDDGELSTTEQLLDSCTIVAAPTPVRLALRLMHALVAPVGLRFHALHHWVPSLPYHNLGRAHRRLVAALQPNAPYLATIERGFVPAWRKVWQRAQERAPRG